MPSLKRKLDTDTIIYHCPICISDIKDNQDICILECGHAGCDICMQQWLQEKQECPLCRSKNICCQHIELIHHRKEVLISMLTMKQDETITMKKQIQELNDRIMASEMSETIFVFNIEYTE